MLQVKFTTPTGRKTESVDPSLTIKQVLIEKNIEFNNALVSLDGSVLSATEMNTSFDALGVTGSCFLSIAAQKDNA